MVGKLKVLALLGGPPDAAPLALSFGAKAGVGVVPVSKACFLVSTCPGAGRDVALACNVDSPIKLMFQMLNSDETQGCSAVVRRPVDSS